MAQESKSRKIFDGRYEILSIVGRGACSVVYHARHIASAGSDVALKVLLNKKNERSSSERLRKEALAMVSSRHRYVIRLDDFRSVGDLCYLAMEYAAEGDLRRYAERSGGRLDAIQAERFLLQAVEALGFIHRAGIVHRDIKPDNILVLNESEIRLADFGVAVIPGEESSLDELQRGVGTMDYMAPEVLEGTRYDHRSDVYALGVTFYELLTGKHPFAQAPLMEQLLVRADGSFPPLSALAPEVPGYLATTIMQAMSSNPEQRFPSAREMLQTLLLRKSGQEPLSASAPSPAQVTPTATVAPALKSNRRAGPKLRPRKTVIKSNVRFEEPLTSFDEPPPEVDVPAPEETPFAEAIGESAPVVRGSQPQSSAPATMMAQAVNSETVPSPYQSPPVKPEAIDPFPSDDDDDDGRTSIPDVIAPVTAAEDRHREPAVAPEEKRAPVHQFRVQEPLDRGTVAIPPSEVGTVREITGAPRQTITMPAEQPSSLALAAALGPQDDEPESAPPVVAMVAEPGSQRESIGRPKKHSGPAVQSLSASAPSGSSRSAEKGKKQRSAAPAPTRKAKFSLARLVVITAIVGGLFYATTLFRSPSPKGVVEEQPPVKEAIVVPDGESIPRTFEFPHLPPGLYSGSIEGVIPGERSPLTIVSEGDSLAFVLGVSGWTPHSVKLPPPAPAEGGAPIDLRVVSNGYMLIFSGQNIDGETMSGVYLDLVTGKRGQWEATIVKRER